MYKFAAVKEILNNAPPGVTVIDTIWLGVFAFRLLGLEVLANAVLEEKKANVSCSTRIPEYQDADKVGYLSYTSFWQIRMSLLLVSTFIYQSYVKKTMNEEQPIGDSDLGEDRTRAQTDQNNIRINRKLRRLYVFHTIFKIVLEGVFIALHCYVYGFQLKRRCVCEPSSSLHGGNCYYVKASQEYGMMTINLAFDCLSLFLCLLDICLLGWEKVTQQMTNRSSPRSPELMMEPQNLSM